MTDSRLRALLGSAGPDPGCEAGFELLDEYCDAVARGEPLDERFAGLLAHMASCDACREDTEALLAAIREVERNDPG